MVRLTWLNILNEPTGHSRTVLHLRSCWLYHYRLSFVHRHKKCPLNAPLGGKELQQTAMDGHEHQLFDNLLWWLVTLTIFVHCQRLIAKKLAEFFSFHCGIRPFYTACCFDELSRGFVSCLLNASFRKRFRNATTRFSGQKSMTMASAGAIWGEYFPNGGIQWLLM